MHTKTFLGVVVLAGMMLALSGFGKGVLMAEEILGDGGSSVTTENSITISDLGVTNVGSLPTSKLYFLKEWRRGIRRLFTFNTVKKIELELKITNEKAAELLKVSEGSDDESARGKALENYGKGMERLKARFTELKETSENPNVDGLVTKLLERAVLHTALFDELAEKTKHDTVKNSIGNIRARMGTIAASASLKDTPEKFAARVEKALEESKGGDFKHFRSIGFIDDLEDSARGLKDTLKTQVKTSPSGSGGGEPATLHAELQKVRGRFEETLAKNLEETISSQSVVGGLVPGGAILSAAVSAKITQAPGDNARKLVILEEILSRKGGKPQFGDILVRGGASDGSKDVFFNEVFGKISDDLEKIIKEDSRIAEKAEEQITRADAAIREFASALEKFITHEASALDEKSGPIRIDSTPARISTNMTIERQTPKRDFGDRMKAGLETAGGILANGKTLFVEEKFGEAFSKARQAEVLAKNGVRSLSGVLRPDQGGLEDDGMNRIVPEPSTAPSPFPIPAADGSSKEGARKVSPEKTNARTVCDDAQTEPACPRGEILECRSGAWVCIGPATGGGIIPNPTESPRAGSNLLPTLKDSGI